MTKDTQGWIVSLWIDTNQDKSNKREGFPYLSWSPYDRITINKTEKFSEFFEPKENVSWNGTVQRLHLIPMQKNFNWEPGEKCLIDVRNKDNDHYGMYCVITARLKQCVSGIKEIKDSIYQKLSQILQERDISWQGFHSLGAEDFVGIFLADTIKNLSEIVEIFQRMTFTRDGKDVELFGAICSFCGLNDPGFSKEPGADLLIRLNVKSGLLKEEARVELENELKEKFALIYNKIEIKELMLGKGCFQVEIPNHKELLSCFREKNGVFNGTSEFYGEYIASSRTYWSVVPETKLNPTDVNIGMAEVHGNSMPENNDMDETEKATASSVSGFILKEYKRMIHSNNCLWWKTILQRQYRVYAAFVEAYMKQGDNKSLYSLNNKVQTVLLHINQATAPIYEIPYHDFYYSGSYNDILKMYYGIIAAIFNLGHELPRKEGTKQYNTVFCVDFEAAAKVHSTMYKLKDGSSETSRFVIFHLPYNAFMEFGKTIRLLFHETLHYIAPYDRRKRNLAFVKAWTFEVFEKYKHVLKLSNPNWGYITKYFYNNFDNIFEKIGHNIPVELQYMILNDFTEENKTVTHESLLCTICQVICEEIEENLGFIKNEVGESCKFENVSKIMFSEINKNYLFESVRRVALAAKEAFCDLNMLFALDMTLEQYLMLIQDILFEQNEKKKSYVLDGLKSAKGKKVRMGSFELRIGMVFDQYLYKLAGEDYRYKDKFNRDIFKEELDRINYSEVGLSKQLCQYLLEVYNQYELKYEKRRMVFAEFFELEKKWFENYKNGSQMLEKLRNAAFSQGLISESLTVLHDFMEVEVDNNLLNLPAEQRNPPAHYSLYPKWNQDRIRVNSLGEYVQRVCEKVKDWSGEDFWYRGLCSAEFDLLPSLFRNLDKELSLYANQARFLKGAYYVTLSNPSLWSEQTKGTAEHTCLLQHYGMPTSLLDFSNDMLVALHFALNPDILEDRKKVDEYIYEPKVVLFNPLIYNNAVLSLAKGEPVESPENISPVLFDVYDDSVPEYFVHNMSSEYLMKSSYDMKGYVPNPRVNKYPRPFVIRRSNARILAQSGTFLAYNLLAKPHKDADKPYEYLALGTIQEDYKQLLRDNGKSEEDGEFIREIYIHRFAVPEIKKQLQTMKISTARMYPELHRGFEEYMQKLRNRK